MSEKELTGFSDQDLTDELQRRAVAAKAKMEQKREEWARVIERHLDALLELAEDHVGGASYCNDETHDNYGECPRCAFLAAKELGDWDPKFVLKMSVSREG